MAKADATTETVTVVFTDLVESTELATRVGTERAEALVRTHLEALDEAIGRAGGRRVKRLGDGSMAVFPSASAALACAVAMQRATDAGRRRGSHPLRMRVGMGAGDVLVEDGDCSGAPVVEAARLCAVAAGGQILATELVGRLGGRRTSTTVTALGPRELKGLPEPVEVVEVAWAGPDRETARSARDRGRCSSAPARWRCSRAPSPTPARAGAPSWSSRGRPGPARRACSTRPARTRPAPGSSCCAPAAPSSSAPTAGASRTSSSSGGCWRRGRRGGRRSCAGPPSRRGSPSGRRPTAAPTSRSRAVHGLYWLAVHAAEATPLALVVDDAQWADEASLRWLAYLSARIDDLPLALVVATRDGHEPPREALLQLAGRPGALAVRPAPLSVAATARAAGRSAPGSARGRPGRGPATRRPAATRSCCTR